MTLCVLLVVDASRADGVDGADASADDSVRTASSSTSIASSRSFISAAQLNRMYFILGSISNAQPAHTSNDDRMEYDVWWSSISERTWYCSHSNLSSWFVHISKIIYKLNVIFQRSNLGEITEDIERSLWTISHLMVMQVLCTHLVQSIYNKWSSFWVISSWK